MLQRLVPIIAAMAFIAPSFTADATTAHDDDANRSTTVHDNAAGKQPDGAKGVVDQPGLASPKAGPGSTTGPVTSTDQGKARPSDSSTAYDNGAGKRPTSTDGDGDTSAVNPGLASPKAGPGSSTGPTTGAGATADRSHPYDNAAGKQTQPDTANGVDAEGSPKQAPAGRESGSSSGASEPRYAPGQSERDHRAGTADQPAK